MAFIYYFDGIDDHITLDEPVALVAGDKIYVEINWNGYPSDRGFDFLFEGNARAISAKVSTQSAQVSYPNSAVTCVGCNMQEFVLEGGHRTTVEFTMTDSDTLEHILSNRSGGETAKGVLYSIDIQAASGQQTYVMTDQRDSFPVLYDSSGNSKTATLQGEGANWRPDGDLAVITAHAVEVVMKPLPFIRVPSLSVEVVMKPLPLPQRKAVGIELYSRELANTDMVIVTDAYIKDNLGDGSTLLEVKAHFWDTVQWEYSDDGSAWIEVVGAVTETVNIPDTGATPDRLYRPKYTDEKGNVQYSTPIVGFVAKSYKFALLNSQSGGDCSISILRLYDGEGVEITSQYNFTADSTYSGSYGIEKCLDGNASTLWAARINRATITLVPHEGAPLARSVSFRPRSGGYYTQIPVSFDLQESTDGVNWVSLGQRSVPNFPNDSTVQEFIF
ncbi:galactose-binding domain-like protein [Vibrio phage 1.188.A._10N.286.51.A6]|uniref:Galactose-binding domain-like protein n=4 Tax=Mukerjeevirus TaxID=2733146 RepID=A0A2I7RRZ8_9CAUD|nr:galactose-binding domain-like protein [Vibrio phage 1.188.A._10N.286.51.A6]YP_009817638.1 galactose-binding domain-like protein [Vibrio phage 1.224.A._10N.261.48.B1]AUR93691.1 galactose-binding domain-like protein [Vibrio phage 1.188.B._10N.286.51.A6]AUR93777.1 galactose-binding domain-like protein [Vibrio phage 1.188.C._10N.286.51.A6]AUR93605.1 galactose-binding domain-like protein [Vibrio phage 1.188.A._10N.286.51.A6]AUR96405.1 galactose-binding domain-like protein [Vibrio phage 1.224.A._